MLCVRMKSYAAVRPQENEENSYTLTEFSSLDRVCIPCIAVTKLDGIRRRTIDRCVCLRRKSKLSENVVYDLDL